jgi:hypothetical protein
MRAGVVVVVVVVVMVVAWVGLVGSTACTDQYRAISTHQGRVVHCLCPWEAPMCRGSACSTGHEQCAHETVASCRTVHGYDITCVDCGCEAAHAEEHVALPEQVLVSLTGATGHLSLCVSVSVCLSLSLSVLLHL